MIKKYLSRDLKIIKWAYEMAWKIDKKSMLFWIIISITGALIPVLFLLITQKIIDMITMYTKMQSEFHVIIGWIIALAAFLFLKALYDMIPGIISYTLHTKYAVGMQKKAGELVRRIPLKLFDDHEMSTNINATMPTMKRLAFFLQASVDLISVTIGVIGLLVLAYSTSFVLFGTAFLLMAISMPVGFINAISSYQYWEDEKENERLAEYYYGLVFDHNLAREYRTLGLFRFLKDKWLEVINPMYEHKIKNLRDMEFRWNIATFITTLFKYGIIVVGIVMLRKNALTFGGLVMFVSLFEQLSVSCLGLGRKFMSAYRYVKDLGFQKDLFETDFSEKYPETSDGNMKIINEEPPTFELKEIGFCYTPGQYVLKDISMKIMKGEIVALVGSNGAGKSTLIKLLLGFYTPSEGQLFFQGENYNELDKTKLTNNIGVTFQDYAKFEFTLRENIAFGDLTYLKDDVSLHDAAQKGGAEKIVKKAWKGLDTYMGRWYESKSIELSGGEWQRIAVSRAHLSNRKILVMDEPAAALDPIAEMEQFNKIRETAKERTAILISHRIGFARLADKVAVLDKGYLVEYGSHDELMALKGKYYEMFISQSEWYIKEGVD